MTRSPAYCLPVDGNGERTVARLAAVAGGIGGVIAVVAWFLGIPLLSGLLMLIGAFMFAMACYTLIHEGRKGA